ncbi:MAG: hypothetical protein AW09_000502 [Candidatus Accumulibacter phosphatis]|uniref:Uncharacterized protein n=1 Tax=Candidatus Accumulibacter phosphatis TaxID=327160 RepID=A0A080LZH3_9PROT|nr:MAG: hypothetical protein AW09_000502 [Candidatus Accumulibacter phosphatis]
MFERPVVRSVAEQLRAERHAQGHQISGVAVSGQGRAAALTGKNQQNRGTAVGEPDIRRQRQAGAQAATDQEIRREAPASDDGEEVAEQWIAAGGACPAVAPEDQSAAGQGNHDADEHQAARAVAKEQERSDADPQQIGRHQRGTAGHRGVFERGDPGGEMQRQEEAGAAGQQDLPAAQRTQCPARLPEGERGDDQRREAEAQRGDGQGRQAVALGEARQNGAEGDRQQADAEDQKREPARRRLAAVHEAQVAVAA